MRPMSGYVHSDFKISWSEYRNDLQVSAKCRHCIAGYSVWHLSTNTRSFTEDVVRRNIKHMPDCKLYKACNLAAEKTQHKRSVKLRKKDRKLLRKHDLS